MPGPFDHEIAEIQRRNAERKAGVVDGMEWHRRRTARRAKIERRIITALFGFTSFVSGMFLGGWLW